jgi:hypothetical protein
MSSSAQRDESFREWLSYIPALLTATGLVLYGMLGTAYSLFWLYATKRGERPGRLAVWGVCHLTPQCNSSRSR